MFQKVIDENLALVLNMPHFADELFALSIKNKEHLKPWFPWANDLKCVQDTKTFIYSQLQGLAKGEILSCLISYKRKIIGVCDLHKISQKNKKASIGYWIDKDYEGQGLASKAVGALIEIAFKELGLKKLSIYAQKENIKSQNLAQRLAFKKVALLEAHLFMNGEFKDFYLFEKVKQ